MPPRTQARRRRPCSRGSRCCRARAAGFSPHAARPRARAALPRARARSARSARSARCLAPARMLTRCPQATLGGDPNPSPSAHPEPRPRPHPILLTLALAPIRTLARCPQCGVPPPSRPPQLQWPRRRRQRWHRRPSTSCLPSSRDGAQSALYTQRHSTPTLTLPLPLTLTLTRKRNQARRVASACALRCRPAPCAVPDGQVSDCVRARVSELGLVLRGEY